VSARRVAVMAGPVVLTLSLVASVPAASPTPTAPEAAASGPAAERTNERASRIEREYLPGGHRTATATATAAGAAAELAALPAEEAAEPPATTLAETDLAALETDSSGIPARVLVAYRAAAARLARDAPGCRLRWELLAGIGRIESDHGRYRGAVVQPDGRVAPPILGPRLDGSGPFAVIRDTDGGRYDGDAEFDRAVGPMQFIPSTWKRWGVDADGDGVDDPQDIDDAALAAGRYLCHSGRLDQPAGMIKAVFSYNRSYDYVRAVLTVAAKYAGVSPLAFGTGLLPAPRPPAAPAAAPAEAPPPPAPAPPPPAPAPPPPAPAPGTAAAPAPGPSSTAPAPSGGTSTSPDPSPGGTPAAEPTTSPAPSSTGPSPPPAEPAPDVAP
jgi:membrane-bound lytic murein transglycosylase B